MALKKKSLRTAKLSYMFSEGGIMTVVFLSSVLTQWLAHSKQQTNIELNLHTKREGIEDLHRIVKISNSWLREM